MKYLIKIATLIGITAISQIAYSGSITDTFVTGDTLTAAHLKNAKAAVNDNDARITTLETGAGESIAVDCTADVSAFLNTTIKDNTTYTLSGMCDGPIQVFRNRNIIIQGVDTNTKTDGVILPAGITVDPFAAIGVYESSVELRNLRIDASNYVTNSYPWGATFVEALSVGQQSIARVYDVDLVGGDYSLDVFRGSYVKTYSNVTVTGSNIGGVSASYNSHVELSQSIQVVGAANTTSPYPEAVSAYKNSSIEIKNGGTFTPPGSGLALENYSIIAMQNSTVRVRNSGTSNLNGVVGAGASGVASIKGGAVITGHVDAWDQGYIRIENSSQTGGYISAVRNSSVRIGGSSVINHPGFGITASTGGSIGVRGSTTVTSGGPLGLSSFATLYLKDTVDFGSIGITCQMTGQVSSVGVGVTNVGTLTGC